MNWFEAVVLGVIQGFTEFLPVSSSGHLVIAQGLLGVPMPGVFIEVVLHVATLLSVVIVYRARLLRLVTGAVVGERDAWSYIGLLALATVPAAFVGLLFEDRIEAAFDLPVVTGVMLLVTGVLLWSTRFVEHERMRHERPNALLALAMGIAQAFAILPGISRSGTTITAGLWGRLDGERAAEFSFLMSIPAIAGAAVLQMRHLGDSMQQVGGAALSAGFVAGLVSGVLAIRALIWMVRHEAFDKFAYYVWIVGGLYLVYLGIGG